MPFSQFSASFDPETLDLLTAAFNAAWDQLQASGTDLQADEARQLLAVRIFQAFSDGERDAASLTAYALHGLSTNEP